MRQIPLALALGLVLTSSLAADEILRITVTLDRGPDRGQCFGSLFEATSADGSMVVGAGFQNAYNTRYRADRHDVQFYVRPTDGWRELSVEELPRPSESLTGAYLFGRDGRVYSTYGGLKVWNPEQKTWAVVEGGGGTEEKMRVGNGILEFGDSTVRYDDRLILSPPDTGSYQLFFYTHGYLCFYHVNRGDGPYRLYQNDEDGFSRLYACPWTPDQPQVDLAAAVKMTLPVVGETTFAWGQLGDQIVTGSNIGGFYVFEDRTWKMLLEPKLGVSYQLYSTLAFHDRLLMGQYPTGRVFQYDGQNIKDLPGWPPVLEGVSSSAREAQTTVLYGGELFVGVWPWAEVWRYHPDTRQWKFGRRMFDHPAVSDKIVHPYDFENQGNSPQNLWGQRITSLVTNGPDLFVSTSAKAPYKWNPQAYPFLAPDKWKSYGKVYRVTMPGHLSAPTKWTDGPTKIEFHVDTDHMQIFQNGKQIGSAPVSASFARQLKSLGQLKEMKWGEGIYGRFSGRSIEGTIPTGQAN
jgi:hypothetical protein